MRLFLRRSHPTFFIAYQGVIVAALGTGVASILADPDAPTPPILASFYGWLPINAWGWIYLAVGVVLMVGLFVQRAARVGIGLALLLLSVRLGFQLQQTFLLWHNGASARELLPSIAGLPILYAFVSSVLAMAMEPFSNPATSPDKTVIVVDNGEG